MNLTSLKEQLLKNGEKIGLSVHEETAQYISLHAEITAKAYFDDSIYCRITVYESGTFHMFLTFYEIERTYENFYLINNFNAEHPWFKAYIANINGKDFLELHHSALELKDEKEVVDTVGYLLTNILEEATLNLLQPIVNGNKDSN